MRKIFVACILLISSIACAQGAWLGSYATTVGVSGQVVALPGAKITACGFPATGQTSSSPCTNTVNTYTSQTLITLTPVGACTFPSLCNPQTTDSQGNYGFWVPPSLYQLSICVGSVCVTSPATYAYQGSSTSFLLSQNNTWTGSNSFQALSATSFTAQNVLSKAIQGCLMVDDANTAGWAGADKCAQEQSAEAALPSYGGCINMTALQSATQYNCTGPWTIGASKAVQLWLPQQAIVVSGTGSNPYITVSTKGTAIIGYNSSGLYGPGGSSRLQTNGGSTGDLVKWTASNGILQDVSLVYGNPTITGLHVTNNSAATERNEFRNVQVLGDGTAGQICIDVTANSVTNLTSFNKFYGPMTQQCDKGIQLDTSGTQGPTDNFFFGAIVESTLTTTAGVNITGSTTASNHVIGGHCSGSGPCLVTGGGSNTIEYFRTEGGIDVNDTGLGNMFIGDSFSNCTTSTFAASAVLLGNWSNTQCPFDQFPRGLTIGANGLKINGGAALSAQTGSGSSIVTNTGATINTPTINETNLLISPSAPTIASGFGTSPSVASNNGTASFRINVGTGGTASQGTIGLPTAANVWNCFAFDITNSTVGGGFTVKQTGGTTNQVVMTGFNAAGTQTAWTASDILQVSCFAQ